MSVRVRFAPSPTGNVHIGNIRVAIFNWLFARNMGGKFLLRIEDTDLERSTPEAVKAVLDALDWLGLDVDEEPMYQSTRREAHLAAAEMLLEKGLAYKEDKGNTGKGECVIFKMPDEPMAFHDEIKGELTKEAGDMKDLVIVRSDGSPVFHLANVVDDIEMGITHIIRGDDHIENTYRHVALFKALGAQPPKYAHLPMITNQQGKPYSKRDGDAFVGDFWEKGYDPHAMFNYLTLLGWSPGDDKEKMPREEIIKLFSFDRVKSSPAQMDIKKLTAMNGEYIAELDRDHFISIVNDVIAQNDWAKDLDVEYFKNVCDLMQSRAKTYLAVNEWKYFFSDDLDHNPKDVRKLLNKEGRRDALIALKPMLAKSDFSQESIETALRAAEKEAGVPEGKMNQAVRVAVTGISRGAGIYETIELLGKQKVLTRIGYAIANLFKPKEEAAAAGGRKDKPSKKKKEEAPEAEEAKANFIREKVAADNKSGKFGGKVITRFPPEPNGYLHIGHAKAICLDFGIAAENNGVCNLRFDDTNPSAEEVEYVESIKEDVKWLGFDWGENLFYASDYFDRMYEYAVKLIKKDKAYVCTLGPEEFKDYRGVPTRPGKESPSRNRPVEESLDLFERMKKGEFEDGAYVVRAKIDMASPNLHMRDPVIYRIKKEAHHRTGDKWCIYPMYDFAHCLEDSIEGVTHSLCTLEFEVHRPLYDWFLDELEIHHSEQTEFARLNLTYTVMSKRKLLELVNEKYVGGWDDPRMPTISGLRRRGYTPEAVRAFMEHIGITKVNSLTDTALLEHFVREDLNRTSSRVMAVMKPLKVVIDNYPEEKEEFLDAVNNPEDKSAGTRMVPFAREIYIEREDFMEEPPAKFFRLAPGREVRLRYAYFIKCERVVKDENGEITEVHCTYDPETRGGNAPDGRKVKATLHWVSASHAYDIEVRLYDRLFTKENPADESDGTPFKAHINKNSLEVVKAVAEPAVAEADPGDRYQFERLGYFCVDSVDTTDEKLVFNRTVALKDDWKKQKGKK